MTREIRNSTKHRSSAIIGIVAFIVLMVTMAVATAGQVLTFGTQKELDLTGKYSGFSMPFETENVFASREASRFCSGQPGHPALPQQTIRLLLPLDADISAVEVTVENTIVSKLD